MKSKFLSDIRDIVESSLERVILGSDGFSTSIDFPSFLVDIRMNAVTYEVEVIHKNNDHWSPNVEEAIVDVLPEWYEVLDRAMAKAKEEDDFQDYLRHNCVAW